MITHVQITFDNKVLLKYKLEDVNPLIAQWVMAQNPDADRVEVRSENEVIIHNQQD